MKRKISLGTAIILVAIVASVTCAVSVWAVSFKIGSQADAQLIPAAEKLIEIDRNVRESFYGDIDDDLILEYAAKGYVRGLDDKYAEYYTPEEYSGFTMEVEGQSVGIGVFIMRMSDPDGLKITEIFPGSPAEAEGLRTGDVIVQVNGIAITEENASESVAAIRGEPGTTVVLTIQRGDESFTAEVTRQDMEVPTVTSEVYGKVGYLRIKEFMNPTPDHFEKKLDKVLEQGVGALIFDVRENPGGSLNAVSEILDRLLPEGDLVLLTDKNGDTMFRTESDAEEITLPMVVIADKSSVSAAELFAQAIKDFGKGVTVGTVTYGKGVVQNVIEFDDGSAVKITTGEYSVGKSPNFDGIGVMPDYEVEFSEGDSCFFSSLDMNTDPQMQKALELANAVMETGSFDAVS